MASLSVDDVTLRFYEYLDPGKTGRIQAQEAATFLRTSGIQDGELAVIWNLADRNKAGFLDIQGLAVAIKLVAVVQSGHNPTMENLRMNVPTAKFAVGPTMAVPGPNVGSGPGFTTPERTGTPPARPSRPPVLPDKQAAAAALDAWVVDTGARTQYESIFYSLNPANNKLSGGKVKPILMKSGLHVAILGQVWELSDIDKDGNLDIEEFTLAMYLLNKAREGEKLPTTLPQNYIPPTHRVVYSKVQKVSWIVPRDTRIKANEEFQSVDISRVGVLSGLELRPVLLKKGVPTLVLARIWTLCDIQETGKLNSEQYALALHLIELQKRTGKIPEYLTTEYIPPSLRQNPTSSSPHLPPRAAGNGPTKTATLPPGSKPAAQVPDRNATLAAAGGYQSWSAFAPPTSTLPGTPSTGAPSLFPVDAPQPAEIPQELASLKIGGDNADFSIIKELDSYARETETLTTEKRELQTEIKASEDALTQAGEELKDLKKQLASLEQEVEEARKEKAEIQARVDEVDAERRKFEDLLADLHKKAMAERQQIGVLQQQIASQDALRKSQEDELQRARDDLTKLRQEESHYLHQVDSGKRQLDSLIQNLKIIQNDSNMSQQRLAQLEQAHRTIDKALAELAPFGKHRGGPSILTNIHEVSQLRRAEQDITQMSDITRATAGSSPVSSMSGFSVDSYADQTPSDPNHHHHPHPSSAAAAPSNPFGGTIEEGKDVESGSNTPKFSRKEQPSGESVTQRNDDSEREGAGDDQATFTNPFQASQDDLFKSDDDPFSSAPTFKQDDFAITDDPFAAPATSVANGGDPFKESKSPEFFPTGSGEDLFGKGDTVDIFKKDPFAEDDIFKDAQAAFPEVSDDPFATSGPPPTDPFADVSDPFSSTKDTADPFASSGPDPFGDTANNFAADPFGSRERVTAPTAVKEEEDPFRERNIFTSEQDAFNTHDPFANTPDPFAGSTDLFKGSNNSLNSRGTRGSKNSLNNRPFGSKSSLQDSKTSLNDCSASVTSASSPRLELKTTVEVTPTADPPVDPFASSTLTSASKTEFKSAGFDVDPFSNGDPFSSSTPDPFSSGPPAAIPSAGEFADPFGGGADPFGSDPNDPFFGGTGDPFKPDPSDPFSSSITQSDPFASSGAEQAFKGSNGDFGAAFEAKFD